MGQGQKSNYKKPKGYKVKYKAIKLGFTLEKALSKVYIPRNQSSNSGGVLSVPQILIGKRLKFVLVEDFDEKTASGNKWTGIYRIN